VKPTIAPVTIPLSIPAGAIVLAPQPALVGEANATHLGMTPAELHAVLAEMAKDPAHRAGVVVLSRRPRRLAAAPADVLRFLRARRGIGLEVPSGPAANDAPGGLDEADQVLAELGLLQR
jgi:hypothetical protein